MVGELGSCVDIMGFSRSRDPMNLSESNSYCRALGIAVPKMESVKDHREAIMYGLLIVALLERGRPITLEDAAVRMEEAGVASRARALVSLKRCKPGRVPRMVPESRPIITQPSESSS